MPAPASDDRAKWALLIGINEYPKFPPRGQLSGCVNDVQVMRQVLVEAFNFPEDHITLLADGQATRTGILTAMKELVTQVGENDIVVVHYSGHGSQMTDREGDEADGKDETIVPHDSGRNSHPNLDITDDEIYLWLRDLTAKTSLVTLIFDCCHSGTIVRDAFGEEMRWVEPDLRPLEDLPPSPIPPEARSLLGGGRDIGPSGWLPLGERYVLIAGCSSEERSYEIQEQSGVKHGALTYFLTRELRKAGPGTTYRDLFEIFAPLVTSRLPNQHPQLEGARDLEVLGVHRIELMAFVPVLERQGGRLVLGAGAACGLVKGSEWTVHGAGIRRVEPGDVPLGVVSLSSVRAVTSEGTLEREAGSGAVKAGMRAFELSRPLETRLPVHVEVMSRYDTDVQCLREKLDRYSLLRRVDDGKDAKARVYLLPPSTLAHGKVVPMLGRLAEETWAVVGEDGNLMMPAHRRSEGGVDILLENLEKAARHRLVLDLRNETSPLAGKVKAELLRWTGDWLEEPKWGADSRPVFFEGDNLALKIANESAQPLFVYVLDLGLTGRISQVYPVPGAKEGLEPGRMVEVGARDGEELELYIPKEFPFASLDSGESKIDGFETLKIFATTQPTEFLPFFQPGFRGCKEVPAGPVRSLKDVLSASFGGGGCRDLKPPQGNAPEEWTTVERSFRLRRRVALSEEMMARGRTF